MRHLLTALAVVAALLAVGAIDHTGNYFTVTGIGDGEDSAWMRSPGYEAECIVYGTWGGASADVETFIQGTTTPDVKDVDVTALLSITSDTSWESIRLGRGDYRLEVTGGTSATSLTLHCRKVTE